MKRYGRRTSQLILKIMCVENVGETREGGGGGPFFNINYWTSSKFDFLITTDV